MSIMQMFSATVMCLISDNSCGTALMPYECATRGEPMVALTPFT